MNKIKSFLLSLGFIFEYEIKSTNDSHYSYCDGNIIDMFIQSNSSISIIYFSIEETRIIDNVELEEYILSMPYFKKKIRRNKISKFLKIDI